MDSFRPGVADRLGIGYEACRNRNPNIVYAAITGYGRTARGGLGRTRPQLPGRRGRPGGAGSARGRRTCDPGHDAGRQCGRRDARGAGHRAALVGGDGPRRGADLDVSAAEGVLAAMALAVDDHLATGAPAGPGDGLLTGRYACYDVYRCADDRWVAVGAIERRFWTNLCEALGHPEHAAAQHATSGRTRSAADLAAAFATRPRDAWVAQLGPADTCVSPVLTIDEVATSTYARDRGLVSTIEAPDGARIRQLAPVIAGAPRPPTPVRVPRSPPSGRRVTAATRHHPRPGAAPVTRPGPGTDAAHRGRSRPGSASSWTPASATSPASRATSPTAARRARTPTPCTGTPRWRTS